MTLASRTADALRVVERAAACWRPGCLCCRWGCQLCAERTTGVALGVAPATVRARLGGLLGVLEAAREAGFDDAWVPVVLNHGTRIGFERIRAEDQRQWVERAIGALYYLAGGLSRGSAPRENWKFIEPEHKEPL